MYLLRANRCGRVDWTDERLMDAVAPRSPDSASGLCVSSGRRTGAPRRRRGGGCRRNSPQNSRAKPSPGSGELLHRSKSSLRTLRQNTVNLDTAAPTAAALEVLMGPDGMQSLLTRAVAAATRRSRELAK